MNLQEKCMTCNMIAFTHYFKAETTFTFNCDHLDAFKCMERMFERRRGPQGTPAIMEEE